MPESVRPLLSIAIPTFNRAPFLGELLECLLPQLAVEARVELLLSDNDSTDETPALVARFEERGLRCRYLRNETNVGPDANFLQCLELARGTYVWVLGDDDLLAPGTIAKVLGALEGDAFDLVYLSSVGFAGVSRPSHRLDPLGRFAEVVTDGAYFLNKVNALVGLISVVIINKERLSRSGHPPIRELTGSNLLQLGWIFPLLHARCRVLYVWERLVFYRNYNSGGWGVCEVFGVRMHAIAERQFRNEPQLASSLMNGVLRFWMCDKILEMRLGREEAMQAENFAATLRPLFGNNWRFRLFIVPVAEWPLPLARCAHALLHGVNRVVRAVEALLRFVVRRRSFLKAFPRRAGASATSLYT